MDEETSVAPRKLRTRSKRRDSFDTRLLPWEEKRLFYDTSRNVACNNPSPGMIYELAGFADTAKQSQESRRRRSSSASGRSKVAALHKARNSQEKLILTVLPFYCTILLNLQQRQIVLLDTTFITCCKET